MGKKRISLFQVNKGRTLQAILRLGETIVKYFESIIQNYQASAARAPLEES